MHTCGNKRKRVRFKSDEPHRRSSKRKDQNLVKIQKDILKTSRKKTNKKIHRLIQNLEIINSNQKKIKSKMLKSKENYKRKLSKLKRQMQTQPSEKENQLVDQLKYNPKFDILNREHLLNKDKFFDDEFHVVSKYKKLRDQMQQDYLKNNKNGIYGKGRVEYF